MRPLRGRIAGHWHPAQTQNFDWQRGTGFLDRTALVIVHRADAARLGADDEDVTGLKRAAIDQHGGQWTLALIKFGLDHSGICAALRIGLKFKQFRLKQDFLDQIFHSRTGFGGNLDILHFARHLLDDNFVFKQAFADLF
jgi:hypothetical protein